MKKKRLCVAVIVALAVSLGVIHGKGVLLNGMSMLDVIEIMLGASIFIIGVFFLLQLLARNNNNKVPCIDD